jgi:hypothetical protein
VYFSEDGLDFTVAGTQTVPGSLHSFLITDRLGNFKGWAYNKEEAVTKLYIRKAAGPRDGTRHTTVAALGTISANNTVMVSPARGHSRVITDIKILSTTIAASGTDYWTFELRGRAADSSNVSPTGATVTTIAGSSTYVPLSISGAYTAAAGTNLQLFWTKTGSAANLGWVTVEWTEYPASSY